MPKAPTELAPGDGVFIRHTKTFNRIIDVRFFEEVYSDTFTANERKTNVQWDNLESAEDELYFVSFLALLRNVRVNSVVYRGEYLLGTRGDNASRLLLAEYPDGIGYPMMKWIHKDKVIMDLEELSGLVLPDPTEIIKSSGLFFKLESVSRDELKEFTEIRA